MMAVYDPGQRCQPDPGALEVFVTLQAMKGGEEAIVISHVKSCAIVPHKIGPLRRIPAKLDQSRVPPGRELDGVAKQILQRDTKQARVARCRQPRLNTELNLPFTIFL